MPSVAEGSRAAAAANAHRAQQRESASSEAVEQAADAYSAQINAAAAEQEAARNWVENAPPWARSAGNRAMVHQQQQRQPLDDNEALEWALLESTRQPQPQPHARTDEDDDEEDRLRLAMALSESTPRGPPSDIPRSAMSQMPLVREDTEEAAALATASAQSTLETVLSVLRSLTPILASYVDEHCGVFIDEMAGGEMEVECFTDFRRTVDTLLADLLADHGLNLADVASTLQQAREQETTGQGAGSGTLVQHLLAVESFVSFRQLSAPSPCPLLFFSRSLPRSLSHTPLPPTRSDGAQCGNPPGGARRYWRRSSRSGLLLRVVRLRWRRLVILLLLRLPVGRARKSLVLERARPRDEHALRLL